MISIFVCKQALVCIDNAKVIHSLEHKQLFETSDNYGQTAKREFGFEWIDHAHIREGDICQVDMSGNYPIEKKRCVCIHD
jgi:hypothetical protein